MNVAVADPAVLIVGAGPVGLTLAAGLTKHGLSCRIVDKMAGPTDKSKALVVWSRTLELLGNLGIAERFVQTGMKARGVNIFGNGKQLAHLTVDNANSPFGYPLMIPQSETERLLGQYLQEHGVTVERNSELLSFVEQKDGVIATLRNRDGREETCQTSWLVGCDGAHSVVRHALGMEFTGSSQQDDWILADVHLNGPVAPDELSIFWHDKGILAFFPISPGRFRVIADIGPAGATERPIDPSLADVQAKIDERGPADVTVSQPIWLAGFRINERKVADYRRGRIFLAGDAAHIHSPAGGQGMNTGMQDAFNLVWKLVLAHRGQAHSDLLLDSYSSERSTVGDQVLRGATVLTNIATVRNPLAQFLRNHTASLLASFTSVQDKIRDTLCELSINYRHSPLSAQSWPRLGGGVLAGDRLPDAPVEESQSAHQTTLFDLVRDTSHTLLLMPAANDSQAIAAACEIVHQVQTAFPGVMRAHVILPQAADKSTNDGRPVDGDFQMWIDSEGVVYRQHAVQNTALVLVRPDGYIGFRSQPADADLLIAHLESYLIRREGHCCSSIHELASSV